MRNFSCNKLFIYITFFTLVFMNNFVFGETDDHKETPTPVPTTPPAPTPCCPNGSNLVPYYLNHKTKKFEGVMSEVEIYEVQDGQYDDADDKLCVEWTNSNPPTRFWINATGGVDSGDFCLDSEGKEAKTITGDSIKYNWNWSTEGECVSIYQDPLAPTMCMITINEPENNCASSVVSASVMDQGDCEAIDGPKSDKTTITVWKEYEDSITDSGSMTFIVWQQIGQIAVPVPLAFNYDVTTYYKNRNGAFSSIRSMLSVSFPQNDTYTYRVLSAQHQYYGDLKGDFHDMSRYPMIPPTDRDYVCEELVQLDSPVNSCFYVAFEVRHITGLKTWGEEINMPITLDKCCD